MVGFKAKVSDITEILKSVQATGQTIKGEKRPFLEDCMITIAEKELFIDTMDENSVLYTEIHMQLNKDQILELGNIPVALEDTLKYFKRFNAADIISFTYQNDMIILEREKPKLTAKFKAMPLDAVKSLVAEGSGNAFNYKDNAWFGKKTGFAVDSYIKIDANLFKDVVQDGEQVQFRNFPFSIISNKIEVIVENIDEGEQIVRELAPILIQSKGDVKSLYTYGFGNVFGQLSGEIEIWIANNSPLIIRKQLGTGITLLYILATVELQQEDMKTTPSKAETNAQAESMQNEADALLNEVEELTEDQIIEDAIDDGSGPEPEEPKPKVIPKKSIKK